MLLVVNAFCPNQNLIGLVFPAAVPTFDLCGAILTRIQYIALAQRNQGACDETNATKGNPQAATSKIDFSTWMHPDEWAAHAELAPKGIAGLLQSLAKKGLIVIEADAVDFTDEGFASVMRAIEPLTSPTPPVDKIGPTQAVREFLAGNPQATIEEAIDTLGKNYNPATRGGSVCLDRNSRFISGTLPLVRPLREASAG